MRHGPVFRKTTGCACAKCIASTTHGTREMYRQGCRCDECTKANAKYAADFRARRGIKRTKAQIRAEKRYEKKRRKLRRERLKMEHARFKKEQAIIRSKELRYKRAQKHVKTKRQVISMATAQMRDQLGLPARVVGVRRNFIGD